MFNSNLVKPAPPPNQPNTSAVKVKVNQFISWFGRISFNWKPFAIDADLPLHKHMLFWWPIILFVSLGLALSFPFWCLCLPSPEHYEQLLKQLGLPIFVTSLAIPISVAINRFHASQQRAESNRIARENMAFNNYFDHRKHFHEYIHSSGIPEAYRGLIVIKDEYKLYQTVFPMNSVGERNYSIPKERYEKELKNQIYCMHQYINKWVIQVNDGVETNDFDTFLDFVERIPNGFGLSFNRNLAKGFIDFHEKSGYSFFAFCFNGIKDTLLSLHRFNHKQQRAWSLLLSFNSLINSVSHNEQLDKADNRAMEILMAICVGNAMKKGEV